jgi:hypothetical protein
MSTVMSVFYFTSISLGGYGFSEFQISIFIGIAGLSQAIWLLFVFPSLQRRIGTGGILRVCSLAWPFWFLLTAGANTLLRLGWSTVFWVYAPTVLVAGSGVAMAFSKLVSFLFFSSLISLSPDTWPKLRNINNYGQRRVNLQSMTFLLPRKHWVR